MERIEPLGTESGAWSFEWEEQEIEQKEGEKLYLCNRYSQKKCLHGEESIS